MALNNLGLGFVFTAQNLASGTIGRLRGQLRGLSGESQTAGRVMKAGFGIAAAGLVPLTVGVAGLAASLHLADAAAEFQRNVARVGNISGASADELRQLRDAAIEAGIQTQFSPDEAIEGLATLAAQGLNASDSMRLLNTSLNLAAGGQIGIDEASRASAAAVKIFTLNAEEQATVADRLLKITNLTALQAGDLSLALGTVSRGAQSAHQNLDEMLISMGLVRNSGVDVSVAASSVSSALDFMARRADEFKDTLNVSVTDTNGQFRDFLDIVADATPALESITNEAERAATVTRLFGRFGKTAFTNISAQLQAMIGTTRNGQRIETITDAVRVLREEMGGAAGTAQQFADALLDTFAGQKTLLEGTLQTFEVVLGEPFAAVFKPIVKAVTDALNVALRFFNGLSDPLKKAIAGFIVFASVTAILTGALMVLSGILVVLAPFALAMVKVFVGLTLAILPFIAAVLGAAGAVALAVMAIRRNLGGLGDWWESTTHRLSLLWHGLTQLFTEGGFSGAIREELNRTENAGLRRFVVNIFRIGFRLRQFWEGFSDRMAVGIDMLGGVFGELKDAFVELGQALGFVSEQGAEAAAGIPSRRFAEAGARIAAVVTDVLRVAIRGFTMAIHFMTQFVDGFRSGMRFFAPTFRQVGEAIDNVVTQFGALFREIGIATEDGSGRTLSFGEVVGKTFAGMIAIIASFVETTLRIVGAITWVARKMITAFQVVRDFLAETMVQVGATILNTMDTIRNAIDTVIVKVASVASRIPPGLRPAAVQSLVEEGGRAEQRIAARRVATVQRTAAANTVVAQIEAQAQARTNRRQELQAESRGATADVVAAIERQRRRESPLNVNVQIDGETVARAAASADRRESARGFVPVPSEST